MTELTGTDGLSALHGLHGHDEGEERLGGGGGLGLGGGRLGAKAAGLAAGVLGAADGADGAEGGGNSEEAEGQDALADHHLALIWLYRQQAKQCTMVVKHLEEARGTVALALQRHCRSLS